MTLRQAAEAAIETWEGCLVGEAACDADAAHQATEALRAALSEPDPLAEAEAIIRELIVAELVARGSHNDPCSAVRNANTKARDWLAKREASK